MIKIHELKEMCGYRGCAMTTCTIISYSSITDGIQKDMELQAEASIMYFGLN